MGLNAHRGGSRMAFRSPSARLSSRGWPQGLQPKHAGTCHLPESHQRPNQTLAWNPETLALATPPWTRWMPVDYMKDPTSMDGRYSISDGAPEHRRKSDVFVSIACISARTTCRPDRWLHPGGLPTIQRQSVGVSGKIYSLSLP